MPLRLPPLPALRCFEAAGRHQSFKLAAAELNVTPSAISHGIVGLEGALGVELFVREPRGISLTAIGADYLSYVSEAFSLIAIGTQRLPNHRADRPVALSCAPTFASRWLLPPLAGFRARWPHVVVSVDTSRRQVGFPVDGFDFAIRMSRAPGSFLGAWLGGLVFDLTGSYSLLWVATVAAGLIAALLHFPIDDTVVMTPARRSSRPAQA
ncbi:DNA-binding transcriptional LysR family regulator [Paraburkholderia sp. 32]